MNRTTNTAIDQQIIGLLKARDTAGVKLLYQEYAPLLYGLICKIVQAEDLAENVLQDTFLKVWQRFETYNEAKGRLLAWIILIARNSAIDAIRSRSFQRQKKVVPVRPELSNHVGVSAEMKTDYIGLQEAVNRLDVKYRVVLELAYFLGYSHREIAEQLDLPLGTVKSRIKRGIQELRTQFANERL